jgi:hypothetical protein
MRHATKIAIILVCINCLNIPARAKITYKGGESYSAQACPGGVGFDAADPGTKNQK